MNLRPKELTRYEALAAVMVPWGLTNAGLSFAICSGVETLMPLSFSTVWSTPGTLNGTTSESMPASCALCASVWERRAKLSCSSLETWGRIEGFCFVSYSKLRQRKEKEKGREREREERGESKKQERKEAERGEREVREGK